MDSKKIAEASKIPLICAAMLLLVEYSGILSFGYTVIWFLSWIGLVTVALILIPVWAGYRGVRKFKLESSEAKFVGFAVGLGISIIIAVLGLLALAFSGEITVASIMGLIVGIASRIVLFAVIGIIGGIVGGGMADTDQQKKMDLVGKIPYVAWILVLIYAVCIAVLFLGRGVPIMGDAALITVFMILPIPAFLVLIFGFVALMSQFIDRKKSLIRIAMELAIFLSAFLVIGTAMLYLTTPNLLPPSQCTFPAGITCTTTKLHAVSGQLTLEIGQGTGHTIRVTGITCTQNTSRDYATEGSIIYNPETNVTIASGSKAFVADGGKTASSSGIANVICTDANGNVVDSSIGTQYNGRIYINYTEADTGLQRIAVGTISQRFEA